MNQDIFVLVEHLQGQVADITYVMLAAARTIAQASEGKVTAMLLGDNVQDLAKDLGADQVLYASHPTLADFKPEPYQRIVADLLQEHQPRLVLFGETSIGAEIAGVLSIRLDAPLVSYCRDLRFEDDELQFISQVCGGRILTASAGTDSLVLATMIPGGYHTEDGRSTSPTQLVPVILDGLDDGKIDFKGYLTPETTDVDISKEEILVAVGRGIQNEDNLQTARELADALGGTICASRPVVDQNWLPTTRLVGKSGKHVKPKLYLALGISGAPEHTEAITDSQAIVAVDIDPAAPIFNVADYGAEVDLLELLPELIGEVKRAKGG